MKLKNYIQIISNQKKTHNWFLLFKPDVSDSTKTIPQTNAESFYDLRMNIEELVRQAHTENQIEVEVKLPQALRNPKKIVQQNQSVTFSQVIC